MSTDGSGNNTLNAGVIKSNTGSNTGLTIASDGQITVNQNNPTLTLGTNTTLSTQDYFHAKLSSVQTISAGGWSGISFTAVNDPNSWFNNTTTKFTPTKAGKYFIFMQAPFYSNDGLGEGKSQVVFLLKNSTTLDGSEGSLVTKLQIDVRSNSMYAAALALTAFVDMNGSSDYLYSGTYFNMVTGTAKLEATSHFSGFKIGA